MEKIPREGRTDGEAKQRRREEGDCRREWRTEGENRYAKREEEKRRDKTIAEEETRVPFTATREKAALKKRESSRLKEQKAIVEEA